MLTYTRLEEIRELAENIVLVERDKKLEAKHALSINPCAETMEKALSATLSHAKAKAGLRMAEYIITECG